MSGDELSDENMTLADLLAFEIPEGLDVLMGADHEGTVFRALDGSGEEVRLS